MNRLVLSVISLAATALMLSGCGTQQSSNPTQLAVQGLHGLVHGGQQPVVGATIQLWQTGTTGYGSAPKSLLSSAVTTDGSGAFDLTGLYTCASGSEVYITAKGGQPTTGVTNSSAYLIAGLGLCDNLPNATFININEVTTVGTVWSLAPFMNGLNIGAPSTNQAGLVSAFGDIASLVDTTQGVAVTSTANVITPSSEINAIANSIAACINSSGSASTGCSTLFNAAPNADSTIPADTVTAALNIARNPSRNVTAILNNGVAAPPFQPAISSANDLTLAITYSGGNISNPQATAVDAQGNVWIANAASSTVTEFSHTGTLLSGANGFNGGGSINAPSSLAIDSNGNVWISNKGNSTITELNSSGGNVVGSPYSGGGLASPGPLAFDGFGNLWVTNLGATSVSEFNSSGTPLSGGAGYSVGRAPLALAVNPK